MAKAKPPKRTASQQKRLKQKLAAMDNNYRMKWKTPAERKAACQRVCEHLASGLSQDCFPDADWETIQRYMRDFPTEFGNNEIESAMRAGRMLLEGIGVKAAAGKVKNHASATYGLIMAQRFNWRNKTDVTSQGQHVNLIVDKDDAEL